MAISHLTYIKDASGLAQAKGLPSLIYHEPVLEVRFMRGVAGTTRILTIRPGQSFQVRKTYGQSISRAKISLVLMSRANTGESSGASPNHSTGVPAVRRPTFLKSTTTSSIL